MEKEVKDFEIGPVGDLHRDHYLWRAKDIQDKRLFVVFSSRGAPEILVFTKHLKD
jgi:hypothetical protein